ncbi:hypothetical protein RLDS_11360 [Sphingobium lactosutens DS20]|uniref:Uncharacterized protein n=1 Tax=Sphingobium lactosutens DS20 TaxID=1331060 RepID=T0HGM0_9SPHN|nr:hypothetical protein RLDS_11360 [Sphingobium lactosutens DS20]
MVCPSDGAFATRSLPMMPPEPARLSTTTCCPMLSDIFREMMRAIASTAPPGGKGTTHVMGRDGKASGRCALVEPVVIASAMPARTRRRPMFAR